jgi:hypothetical protein
VCSSPSKGRIIVIVTLFSIQIQVGIVLFSPTAGPYHKSITLTERLSGLSPGSLTLYHSV